jgi:hypothetical protein
MQYFRTWILICCLTVMAFSVGHTVVLDRVMDRHLVKEAELIFMGEVLDRQYRFSSPEQGGEAIPHTFVTFAVEKILKGRIADGANQLTLRFLGGRGEGPDFVRLSGSPLLDIGDRGVFFVRQNGTHACPLVGWQQGFILSLEGQLYTGLGESLILVEDPIRAAQIHPKDIRDYQALFQKLASGERPVDQAVFSALQKETINLMQRPSSLSAVNTLDLSYTTPLRRQAPIHPGAYPGLLDDLMPLAHRQIPRNFAQAMMYRDLNYLLLNPNAFNLEDFSSVGPRDSTANLYLQPRQELPLDQVLLMNRRILEDAYPELLTKSRDQTILHTGYTKVEELMTHVVDDTEMRMFLAAPEESEGQDPAPDPLPKGETLSLDRFMEEIGQMVEALHTGGELERLPAVQSVNPEETFYVRLPQPAAPTADLPSAENPNLTEEDREEIEQLENNYGNPVLRNRTRPRR